LEHGVVKFGEVFRRVPSSGAGTNPNQYKAKATGCFKKIREPMKKKIDDALIPD